MSENSEDALPEEEHAPVLSKLALTAAPFILMYVIFLLIKWLSG